jgi:uncharacterized integral membrane protein
LIALGNMSQNFGKILIIVGLLAVVTGVVFYFFGNKLGFLGKLPGDIRIEKENFSFYFPLTTCILISILVSLIIRMVRYFW